MCKLLYLQLTKNAKRKQNLTNYTYIGFYTGCWSPSLTTGWSGHLFWHPLCAQIKNGTSLCHRSQKTTYTASRRKKALQRLKVTDQRSCQYIERVKLERSTELCMTYGLRDSHANMLRWNVCRLYAWVGRECKLVTPQAMAFTHSRADKRGILLTLRNIVII